MPNLTFEETELLCISSGETRAERLAFLEQMKAYLPDEETELKILVDAVISKLTQMTDTQFEELKPTLLSDFDEQEEAN